MLKLRQKYKRISNNPYYVASYLMARREYYIKLAVNLQVHNFLACKVRSAYYASSVSNCVIQLNDGATSKTMQYTFLNGNTNK